jgi:predicted NACHT family NTPase
MAGQTGRASEAGIKLIRSAMKRGGWTQVLLCERLEISRSTLNQILKGQSVKLENLEEICHLLELEVGQVVLQEASSDINSLVQQFRLSSAESLRKRCGTMRILDMTQPIDSGAIYTDVNILERVAGKTRREIQDLMVDCGAAGFDRFLLGNVKQERVEGLKAVLDKRQLMILGRPGAGKTTFLKRLAIECLNGNFLADRLPIFVTLKEFAETEGQPGILDFMAGLVIPPSPPSKGGNQIEVPLLKGDLGGSPITRSTLIAILESGKALVLLDGLDEVMEQDHDRVIREIREFAERYSQNHIVITCRIAAREYIFQQFTEVEMADFDDLQIQSFADKWFKTKEKNPESTTGKMFWKELESRKPVKELAANPLLLTLLCLEFDNSSAFPQSRSELYDRALNVLLAKWDGQRRILRGEEVYKGLSLKRKETLLGQLAMYTFERGDYFFKEKVATQQIEQYIRNLPGATEDPAALEVDSRAVLKSIESRHGLLSERATGIYSFSHLTFQEYFTAKNILDLSNPAAQEAALGKLVEHIGDKRWKEVFLLVVEGLDNADYWLRLMQQRIDSSIGDDPKLQRLLEWAQIKSASINVTYKPSAIRAFYLALARDLDLDRYRTLAVLLANNIELHFIRDLDYHVDITIACYADADFALDIALDLFLFLACYFDIASYFTNRPDIAEDLARKLDIVEDPEVKRQLQEIFDRLHDCDTRNRFYKCWKQNNDRWTEDLRQIMIKYRNIGHDWQFTDEQKTKLQEYYDANLLLANCLNSECYVSREVREEIEATMLLPVAEIKKWKAAKLGT